MTRAWVLACLCVFLSACSEPASETDEAGSAARVVTLAPNLAELVFAVGAGDQLVGVSAWSDYPRAVLELPEVGDAFMVDQEQLAFLNPDLVLVWESGTPQHTVDELRKRGYRVETVRTRGLGDVGAALRRVGELTGRQQRAEIVVGRFQAAGGGDRRHDTALEAIDAEDPLAFEVKKNELVGLVDSLQKLALEYRLTERLSVEAETGLDSSVDLIYRIERD